MEMFKIHTCGGEEGVEKEGEIRKKSNIDLYNYPVLAYWALIR